MKVLIIEDHLLIRKGLWVAIREIDEQCELFEAATFKDGLAVLDAHDIDIIILDIDIPGGMGVSMIPLIREKRENAAILMHTGYDEKVYALPYLKGGANGYLSKNATHDEFVRAWYAITKKRKYVSAEIQELLLDHLIDNDSKNTRNPVLSLSVQELKVLHLISEGKWNKEIAITMQLKENTISTYKKRIFEKFDVKDERELVKKLTPYA